MNCPECDIDMEECGRLRSEENTPWEVYGCRECFLIALQPRRPPQCDPSVSLRRDEPPLVVDYGFSVPAATGTEGKA